ncbi:MAG: type II secretion system protein GspD [Tenuifilaceae bacterium]
MKSTLYLLMYRVHTNMIYKVMCNLNRLIIIIIGLSFSLNAFCFNSNDTLNTIKDTIDVRQKIELLAKEVEALNKTIDITVSNVSIQEFVRSVANLSGLNINVSPELNFIVVNNFTKVRVADLLIFLCRQYDIKVSIVGNIVDLYKTTLEPKPLRGIVEYDKSQDLLNLDFQSIPLSLVTRQLVAETNKNVFAQPEIQNKLINIYIQKLSFESAIENLTKANNLEVEKNDDGSYFIKDFPSKQQNIPIQQGNESYGRQQNLTQSGSSSKKASDNFELKIVKTGNKTFNVNAVDAPLIDIIKEASKQCGISYYITGKVDGTSTMTLTNIEYEDFLKGLLTGRDMSYIKDDGVYIIGEKKLDKFKQSRVIKFEFRPVDSLINRFPEEIKRDLQIREFSDINCLIVSGGQERIRSFEDFCRQIDKAVPVIMIEVIIVDVKKTTTTETGIDAGFGSAPDKSTGQIFPSVDVKLSTKGINSLIQSFNGLGIANLGNVSRDFYLNIKALETDGILKIRSTPILSTINGNNAKINIGNTEYYLVEQSTITAGQTSVVSTNKNYQSVEAKLEVLIKPFVAGDESITLDITVSQSDFTTRIDKYAPPGKVSREFKSKIRVKNQDMILLGGLEEKSTKESSSGVPILQRIPIIKWFFSSRSRAKSDSKLNIFIRPTIIG